MLIAVPALNDRVAPAFDFCHRVTLWRVDERGCRLVARRRCVFEGAAERAEALRGMGAETLLCGAIGRAMKEEFELRGISVRAGLSGTLAEVVAAFACGALADPRFQLPGAGEAGTDERMAAGSPAGGGVR